jgi:polyhydroxyalkanoate synthase
VTTQFKERDPDHRRQPSVDRDRPARDRDAWARISASVEVEPDGGDTKTAAPREAVRRATPGKVTGRPSAGRRAREKTLATEPAADRVADAVAASEPVAVPSLRSLLGGLLGAVAQGGGLARETAVLGTELARIVAGTSEVAPAAGDRRFADRTWSENPFYRRLAQFYLAWGGSVSRLVEGLESGGHDWRRVEQARFATGILVSALAPTNALASNPAAIKRMYETGGKSLLRGLHNWIDDARHNGGMPSQVDRGAFQVGRDLAVTSGAVIARDQVAELIQYRPSTPRVHSRPLLIVPPPIGRYYFLDLRPGRSFVEYAVSRGLTVFMLSWRNPSAEHGSWDLNTYSRRIIDAIESVSEIAGSEDVNVIGFCAGGILSTTALNHLAAESRPLVHSMSYSVTLLDFGVPAPIGAFASSGVLELARRNSRRKGVIDARSMGSVFTWMRPDDLVFNYWVNNYLMGEKPPAFDILAWNADGTNLPAALHEQFLDIFANNTLCTPGRLSVLDSPVDLSRIRIATFVTGAVTDHLTPWKGCYQTTQLLGGESTFVLSSAGHIASLVNPPGNPRANYYLGARPGVDPEAWLAGAERHSGSWWEPWGNWVTARAGTQRVSPERLGSRRHRPLEVAPGLYVRDLEPNRTARRRRDRP